MGMVSLRRLICNNTAKSAVMLGQRLPLAAYVATAVLLLFSLSLVSRAQSRRIIESRNARENCDICVYAEATYSRCVPDAQSSSQGLHSRNDETALHSSKDMQPKSLALNNLHATHDAGVQVLRGSAPAWCSQLLDTGVDDEYYSAHAEASYHSTDHRSRAIWGGELVITVLIFKPVKIWII